MAPKRANDSDGFKKESLVSDQERSEMKLSGEEPSALDPESDKQPDRPLKRKNDSISKDNNASAAAAVSTDSSSQLLEEDLDELNAKREYNRVCAAKSRDKRKRTLSSLHTKVEAASSLFDDLLEKNKKLRDTIDRTFHETMQGLLGTDGVLNEETKRPSTGTQFTDKGKEKY